MFWRIVFSALATWWAFWGFIGCLFGYLQYRESPYWMAASDAENWREAARISASMRSHGEWVTTATEFGLLWPIPVLFALLIGRLTFRLLGRYLRTSA